MNATYKVTFFIWLQFDPVIAFDLSIVTYREKHERPRDPVHIDVIREVAKAVSIPVIANGVSALVKTFDDIEKYQLETGCSSVILARAAQWNPSIFR